MPPYSFFIIFLVITLCRVRTFLQLMANIVVYYYVWNGYDRDSETVNKLVRHMALNR